MITIDRGNGIELYDETLLVKREGIVDDELEHTETTEYLLDGQVVHRSVHVHLKQGIGIEAVLGKLS